MDKKPLSPQPLHLHHPLLRQGLKLTHLRLFSALAETGRMSAAAEQLSISQPAASRMAAEAEAITRSTLYKRTNRGIVLTQTGHVLAARAARVLMELDLAAREIGELDGGRAGDVRIGTVTGPSIQHILPVVRQARLTHPNLNVHIEVGTSDVLAAALSDGRLDFMVGRLPKEYDPEPYEMRAFAVEPIGFMVRTGHPLLRRQGLRLEDLFGHDWIMPYKDALLRQTVERWLVERNLPLPEKILSTSSFLLTIVSVKKTNAVAPIARAVLDFFANEFSGDDGVAALDLETGMEVEEYALITRRDRMQTLAAQYFIGLVEMRRQRLRSPD